MKKYALVIVCYFLWHSLSAQTLNPGKDRWTIKTSFHNIHTVTNTVSLEKLLHLPSPVSHETETMNEHLIPNMVDGLKEGDKISVTGWIRLVALEDDAKNEDGDYHIQITCGKEDDTCMIVEIPFEDFITDKVLSNKCAVARKTIRQELYNDNEPPRHNAKKLVNPRKVIITGQLFFDAHHASHNNRGKDHMHSANCWELHPVSDIVFR